MTLIKDYFELALNWAPINYQYINLSKRRNHYYTKQDLLVPVNMKYYKCNEKDKDNQTRIGLSFILKRTG